MSEKVAGFGRWSGAGRGQLCEGIQWPRVENRRLRHLSFISDPIDAPLELTPLEQAVTIPVRIVGDRKIDPKMDAPRLFPSQGSRNDQPRNDQHVLKFPAIWPHELAGKYVPTPLIYLCAGLGQRLAPSANPGRSPHQTLERVAYVGQVQRLGNILAGRVAKGNCSKIVRNLRRRQRGAFSRSVPVYEPFQ